jgi:hypothetical protein
MTLREQIFAVRQWNEFVEVLNQSARSLDKNQFFELYKKHEIAKFYISPYNVDPASVNRQLNFDN